ncbi:RNA binding protein [Aureococcus anophagefferens]|uniref:RNA binding protein n=1 Tax=Aureococcus anophagefferens TaxID=44056 RepID=A0ABR1GBK4_AURAN
MMVPPGGGVCQEVDLKCGPACMNGDKCTNSRVYVSGLPRGCTADDVSDMFGGIGVIARERPTGRGVFPDMMPYRVKFYGNDDCLVQYEDSHAAHAAPSFFDGQDLKGATLKVEMAEKKPNQGLPAGTYGWAWTAAPAMESVNSEDSSVDSRSIVVEAPVAPFVQQLFKMVNTGTLIQWSEDGEAIENWNSFARMMNMYQFTKLSNEGKSKRARFATRTSARRLRRAVEDHAPEDDGGAAEEGQAPGAGARAPRARGHAGRRGAADGRGAWRRAKGDVLAWLDSAPATRDFSPADLARARDLVASETVGPDMSAWVKRAIALDRRVCELETENAMLRNLRTLKIPRGASGALGEEGRFLEKELSEDTKRFLVDELSPSGFAAADRALFSGDVPRSRKRDAPAGPRRSESSSSVGEDVLASMSDIFTNINASFDCRAGGIMACGSTDAIPDIADDEGMDEVIDGEPRGAPAYGWCGAA